MKKQKKEHLSTDYNPMTFRLTDLEYSYLMTLSENEEIKPNRLIKNILFKSLYDKVLSVVSH